MISLLFFTALIIQTNGMPVSSGSGSELNDYASDEGEIEPNLPHKTTTAPHKTTNLPPVSISYKGGGLTLPTILLIFWSPCILYIAFCILKKMGNAMVELYISCVTRINKNKQPIIDKQLSSRYIKKLNKTNTEKIKSHECTICFEEVNKNKVVLNCGHVFHKKCLQPWIKQKLTNYEKPSCPSCRDIICYNADNVQYIVYNITYDSDDSYDHNDYYS